MVDLRPVYVAGDGDVKGPANSSNNFLPLFADTTGKLLKSSGTGVTTQGLAILDDNTPAEQCNTIGLGQVNNTSDVNKPVSTAQQIALNSKQDKLLYTPVQQGTGVGQVANPIKIGWSTTDGLKATVDSTDLGYFWTSGNFNPAGMVKCNTVNHGYLDVRYGGMSAIAHNIGTLALLNLHNDGNPAASTCISFERGDSFACYMGLDTDNVMKIGGGSMGHASYPILTTQNLDTYLPGATESAVGAAKVATQALTNAGVDDTTIVTPKKLRFGFSISLTTNGYIVFPSWFGGLVLQWGLAPNSGGNGTEKNFVIPFPNACLSISGSPYGNFSGGFESAEFFNITKTGFTSANSGAVTNSYFAIGH